MTSRNQPPPTFFPPFFPMLLLSPHQSGATKRERGKKKETAFRRSASLITAFRKLPHINFCHPKHHLVLLRRGLALIHQPTPGCRSSRFLIYLFIIVGGVGGRGTSQQGRCLPSPGVVGWGGALTPIKPFHWESKTGGAPALQRNTSQGSSPLAPRHPAITSSHKNQLQGLGEGGEDGSDWPCTLLAE